MKKLALAIKICCFCLLLFSCKNSKQSKSHSLVADTVTTTTKMSQDTSSLMINESAPAGVAGETRGIDKDSVTAPVNSQAVMHGAPDQMKIDSIKNAKQKLRNK